ncbi:hypothetical protein AYO22_02959 [Fonsecaea multimorphosa]|nr:hypothetical protein AYO22_02959 [Fonsecaea multimorphosa]
MAHLPATKASLEGEQQAALLLLESWRRNLEHIVSQPAMGAFQHSQAHLILRTHYLTTRFGACASLDPSEMNHEEHLQDFRGIVLAAEEGLTRFPLKDEARSFSFEGSFLAPLYLTALKCRESGVRRKALELMHLTGAKEGLWHRSELIRVATRVMELEEGLAAFGPEGDPSGIPDRGPMLFYDVLAGLNYRKAGKTFVDVTYLIYDTTSPQRWHTRQETLEVVE